MRRSSAARRRAVGRGGPTTAGAGCSSGSSSRSLSPLRDRLGALPGDRLSRCAQSIVGPGDLAQVVAPGGLDLARAGVEGELEVARPGPSRRSRETSISQAAGPRSCSSRSKRVPPRITASRREGGKEGRDALAQAADHRRPVEADLAGEVLGAALDQPGPAQVAAEAARGPGGRQVAGCWRRPRAARRGARRSRAAPRASPRRRRGGPCGGR